MKEKLKCDSCGGNLIKNGEIFVCQSCGTGYMFESEKLGYRDLVLDDIRIDGIKPDKVASLTKQWGSFQTYRWGGSFTTRI